MLEGPVASEKQMTSFSQPAKNRISILSCRLFPVKYSSTASFQMGGSRCVVQGCSNVSNQEKGIALHISPAGKTERDKWVRFVRTHRKNFAPEGRFMICSAHFEENCFTRAFYSDFRRQIKHASVPTIWRKAMQKAGAQRSTRENRMHEKNRQKVSCAYFV